MSLFTIIVCFLFFIIQRAPLLWKVCPWNTISELALKIQCTFSKHKVLSVTKKEGEKKISKAFFLIIHLYLTKQSMVLCCHNWSVLLPNPTHFTFSSVSSCIYKIIIEADESLHKENCV